MSLPHTYPSRIWVCPGCQKQFAQRWLLVRHLNTVHRIKKAKADEVARQSEYVLSPRYMKKPGVLRINPDDYYEAGM